MTDRKVNGKQLALMFQEGAAVLGRNVQKVDALNVFPVPDGDTGTNMSLTITSGVKEMETADKNHVGKVAKAFSKGLLMGARGNSGVILSQLFRGFSKAVEKKAELTSADLDEAFREGVETAYKAVMKPVEGTILTVAKDAVETGEEQRSGYPVDWLATVLENAESALEKTPDLLPVLQEAGVVDSGGRGLVYIYEGMLLALRGKTSENTEVEPPSLDELVKVEHHQNAQSHLSTEDIEYGYCTELMVQIDHGKGSDHSFDENAFKKELARWGDSLLVVRDDDLIKIHIHAEYPGEVLSHAQTYGSLMHVKIDNMREQHQAFVTAEEQPENSGRESSGTQKELPASYGFITVSAGEGIEELFKSLGADAVVAGGQTMNPSTEDILNAVKNVHAETVYILPNNGNIVMAAEQAAEVSGSHVHVIPTKTLPQGLSALFAFDEDASPEENERAMNQARKQVATGQVTYAVRDTKMGELKINKGDFMGLVEKDIVSAGSDKETVTIELLKALITDDTEIVTLLRGEDGDESVEEVVSEFMAESYPEVELEIHEGGQPLYSYIMAVE